MEKKHYFLTPAITDLFIPPQSEGKYAFLLNETLIDVTGICADAGLL